MTGLMAAVALLLLLLVVVVLLLLLPGQADAHCSSGTSSTPSPRRQGQLLLLVALVAQRCGPRGGQHGRGTIAAAVVVGL
jgi:hypothetical protein